LTDQSQSRANHPSARRFCGCPQHCPSAIAERRERLDLDVWAQVIWPWLTAVDRACPSWGRAMARILLTSVRPDLTVDVGRRYGMTEWTTTRALARLCAAGLLAPLREEPTRARIVLPD
jgi:hypothetical protein